MFEQVPLSAEPLLQPSHHQLARRVLVRLPRHTDPDPYDADRLRGLGWPGTLLAQQLLGGPGCWPTTPLWPARFRKLENKMKMLLEVTFI